MSRFVRLEVDAEKLVDSLHAYVADPDLVDVPTAALLTPQYAATRRALVGERAITPAPGDPVRAGTVYLCHPLLVHAAQRHRGARPRFMAQPPLHLASPLRLDRADEDTSAVERAIREALGGTGESSSRS